MPISQQSLHSIEIKTLKNLINLEMSFDGSSVTAILGPNGNGKSTVLHALACAFEPNENGENHKFSSFFLPNTDALWNGSEFKIIHSYRDGRDRHDKVNRRYKKTNIRWTPRYANRPKRDVIYIGIDKCVPMIESERRNSRINYSTRALTEEIIETILEKASFVLNKRYSAINRHSASGRNFIGVEVEGLRYSALSMSAGEQKIFYIIEKVFKAKKNTLILIDELDLLLHDRAMKALVKVIEERATEKSLQIIFTTHRESILELEGIINIRHILCTETKSLCFNQTKPDAINRLTGNQPRPIEVFVEDDLSVTIISKISGQLRGKKYISIQRYGAAINCFTTVGGLLLSGESCDNSAFVLDGDVYRTNEEKNERINKVITGHDCQAASSRDTALSKIYQFDLPAGSQPEQYLHSIITAQHESDNEEFNEIIDAAKEIVVVDNEHNYMDDLISRLGWDKNTGLVKIIDLISTTDAWEPYINDIKNWMREKIELTRENA